MPRDVGAASVRQAVESSTACIKVLDLEGNLEYMNEGGMCVMEIDDFSAVRGACWPDFWRGEERPKAEAAMRAALSGGVGRFEGYTATAKGNVRYWDVTVSAVPGAGGEPAKLLSVSRDITAQREGEIERERLAAALEAERLKAWSLLDNAPAAVAVLMGQELVHGFTNVRYRESFTSGRDVVGLPFSEVLPEACEQGFDGLLRQVMTTGLPMQQPEAAFTLRATETEPTRTVQFDAVYQPIRELDGTISGVFAHMVDVTERRECRRLAESMNADLERRVAERTEELTRANRDLDQFAHSVAHDLRAPLRSIVSSSRILLEDTMDRLTQEERGVLERQARGGLRLARIVDDLLGFARLANSEVKRAGFDMTALAKDTAAEVGSRREHACEVRVQDGMRAEGDPTLVGYVLTNLIDNACKFSPAGGTVTVGQADGAFYVEDRGVGFDMAHAHKLFVAFERLVGQDEFDGTGVGLANVKRIVEKHGGRVWAESEPGRGSTFWFTLG